MKNSIVVGLFAVTLLVSGTAFGAAQTKPQQKCINSLNKAMAKITGTQNKANAKCIKTLAKTGAGDASACASTDAKVTKAQAKTCPAETKACTEAPEFGHTDCGTVNNLSEYNAGELAHDIYGNGINAGVTLCATDKAGCKCQDKALKGANKLFKAHQKEYNKCKKAGMKAGTIVDDTGLDACMSADLKQKIAKAQTKLGSAITKSCDGVATPFAMGDCVGLTGANLSACLTEQVRCRHCLAVTLSDGLTFDCDDYDDDSDDLSCVDDF